MGRHPGPDKNKIERIRKVLKDNPDGLWGREIARRARISKSTVNRYLNTCMKNEVKIIVSISGLVKLYRLR